MSGFESRAVHVGFEPKSCSYRPVVCPIDLHQACIDEDNLTSNCDSRVCLEKCIASLEHAKYAICFSCGIGAVTSVSHLMKHGEHAICLDSAYGGTSKYLKLCEDQQYIQVTFLDLSDHSVLEGHIRPNTRMVWIETPCNPTIKLVDIAAISQVVKKHANIFLVVDNTFMSPYFQNPLLLGADIVMHSVTKYMNGHSDVLMGAIATNNEDLYSDLLKLQQTLHIVSSPFDCYLVRRGLKTLSLRMERHAENALKVARFLENHSAVEKVFYPGLESHPQHELARRQCRGFSGMISFRVWGGAAKALEFAKKLRVFTLAVSLGSCESLVEIPSLMTASAMSEAERRQLGIGDNMIRLSVGLESVSDLINDIEQALIVK